MTYKQNGHTLKLGHVFLIIYKKKKCQVSEGTIIYLFLSSVDGTNLGLIYTFLIFVN